MPWVIIDVLIGVLALLVLVAVGFRVFQHVKQLLRTAKKASARVGAVTAEINELQDHAPRRSTT